MPRGQIFRMRQLQSIIQGANGVRIAVDIGTPYTTGQTVEKIWLFIDLASMVERNVQETLDRYGIKRAERLAQWCNGRRVNTYWHQHRPALYSDIERIKRDFTEYVCCL